MKRIYIAGPMTGYPELNFPAFHAAAAEWRAKGWHVENPAEINPDPDAGWHACMRKDIPRLLKCDAVYLLPGWKRSRGARLEAHIAREMGLELHEAPGIALTAREATALHFIRQNLQQRGKMPSFKALGIDLGVLEQEARRCSMRLASLGLVEPHKQRRSNKRVAA